jgi:peptidoglycan/xylan/chitin deacetylase (PgdA/CDA1 family)
MSLRLPMRLLRTASHWYSDLLLFGAPPGGTPRVALTFDDGPTAEHTPRILNVLQRFSVPATFFFQGSNVNRNPDLVRRAHAEGHQVAGHGIDHVSALKLTGAAVLRDAEGCHELLESVVGAPLPRYFRPPYGDMTLGGLRRLNRGGFRIAYWTYDSDDSFVKSAADIERRFASTPPPPGSVVLFHDDYGVTAEALPAVIGFLRSRGLGFATVHDLHHTHAEKAA